MHGQDGHPLSLPSMLKAPKASAADEGGLGDFGDEAGLDDETEMLMLQQVLKQTMEKKRVAVAKQQAQVLEEFKAAAEKRFATLEAAIAKEAKDSSTAAKGTFTKTTQRLEEKVAQMEALTHKYQQEMAGLWEQYGEEHAKLENTTLQIKMEVEQRKQGVKRRIAALTQENETALAEATKKVEAVKGKTSKQSQLAKLLQSLAAGGDI